jgi:surface protein
MFSSCSSLQTLDVSGWDTGNVTNMSNMFSSCSSLQTLDVSGWDTGNVTNMHAMFHSCSSLQSLDVSGWDTGNVTNMYAIFGGCSSLQSLDVSGWNVSSVTNTSRMFENCKQLQTLIGNRTIEDVIANNISALNGLKVALELYLTILDRASLRAVINGLADLTGQTTQTLRLGGALIAKITEEDIAIATAKNWTIA